jgi:hypothetical protein
VLALIALRSIEQKSDRMKSQIPIVLCLALASWVVPITSAGFQGSLAPAPAPTEVPEELLDGNPNFNLALLIQADLRGNYGPCG